MSGLLAFERPLVFPASHGSKRILYHVGILDEAILGFLTNPCRTPAICSAAIAEVMLHH